MQKNIRMEGITAIERFLQKLKEKLHAREQQYQTFGFFD